MKENIPSHVIMARRLDNQPDPIFPRKLHSQYNMLLTRSINHKCRISFPTTRVRRFWKTRIVVIVIPRTAHWISAMKRVGTPFRLDVQTSRRIITFLVRMTNCSRRRRLNQLSPKTAVKRCPNICRRPRRIRRRSLALSSSKAEQRAKAQHKKYKR